jgi:hypothetical protein
MRPTVWVAAGDRVAVGFALDIVELQAANNHTEVASHR